MPVTRIEDNQVFEPGVVKIAVNNVEHNGRVAFHSHSFWEFVYVDSGFAIHTCAGETSMLTGGDLFVIAPGETHAYTRACNTVLYNCLFRASELGEEERSIFSLPGFSELRMRAEGGDGVISRAKPECIRLNFTERHEIMTIIEKMKWEKLNHPSGWQQMMKSLLIQLLVFYSRLDVYARRAERRSDSYLGHTYKVLKYLEENYDKNISARELSEATGLSSDYISKQFKRELSMTPTEYLRRYRIAKSMEMLRTTDMPIADIARSVGIDELSVFSRLFKQFAGESPSNYRKLN